MFKSASLCSIALLVGALCACSVRSSQEESVVAPVVGGLISGGIANYALSQATVASEREWAAAVVYYYQNHLAIYSVETVSRAYRILTMTDEQIEKELYWRKIFGSFGVGVSVAAIMYCILNSDASAPRVNSRICFYYPLYIPSYAAHYYPY